MLLLELITISPTQLELLKFFVVVVLFCCYFYEKLFLKLLFTSVSETHSYLVLKLILEKEEILDQCTSLFHKAKNFFSRFEGAGLLLLMTLSFYPLINYLFILYFVSSKVIIDACFILCIFCYSGGGIIGVTEPRRVAAISMSSRVAMEMSLTSRQVTSALTRSSTFLILIYR